MGRWADLQPHLRQMIGDEEYATWVAPLAVLSEDETCITIASGNPIVTEWVRDHLIRDVESVARSRYGAGHRIILTEHPEPEAAADHVAESLPLVAESPINPLFTFQRFVIGPSNQFACAAAEAVADRPGDTYNPLYLYGDTGLGKTHLLNAIANRVVTSQPELQVLYMTTEHFVNLLILCIRRKRMEQFRQTFRGVDLLLLDDIQFIGGKERTQEEFFHTFNTLQSAGRQVVFTSDCRPANIPGLEERLRSRLFQGLIADIQPPELETRCAILREKARANGRNLPEDVVMYISRRVQKNVRELEGCLNSTLAKANLTSPPDGPITLEHVRSALVDVLPGERSTTPADIIRFVARHYGIRVSDVKGRASRRSIALPRQVAIFLIREILGLSFPEIGKLFGKHHSTAMYAMDAVNKMRQSKPDFDATLTAFVDHFNSTQG